eukprot:gnl/MRDRNA2_/MRDRNA2_36163_c0_seq1.p1 gnl/MRDRNA2_/MRDRNA2_36163_c0~~gnl/MRDRNA2_/MRDRNA2_36163_c0_seq1.p1  ORF type:complete len:516 (+),score=106.02 gnl/MRDRNA2_/MRDRNA2_36163_c0_seq1:59-1606(+)
MVLGWITRVENNLNTPVILRHYDATYSPAFNGRTFLTEWISAERAEIVINPGEAGDAERLVVPWVNFGDFTINVSERPVKVLIGPHGIKGDQDWLQIYEEESGVPIHDKWMPLGERSWFGLVSPAQTHVHLRLVFSNPQHETLGCDADFFDLVQIDSYQQRMLAATEGQSLVSGLWPWSSEKEEPEDENKDDGPVKITFLPGGCAGNGIFRDLEPPPMSKSSSIAPEVAKLVTAQPVIVSEEPRQGVEIQRSASKCQEYFIGAEDHDDDLENMYVALDFKSETKSQSSTQPGEASPFWFAKESNEGPAGEDNSSMQFPWLTEFSFGAPAELSQPPEESQIAETSQHPVEQAYHNPFCIGSDTAILTSEEKDSEAQEEQDGKDFSPDRIVESFSAWFEEQGKVFTKEETNGPSTEQTIEPRQPQEPSETSHEAKPQEPLSDQVAVKDDFLSKSGQQLTSWLQQVPERVTPKEELRDASATEFSKVSKPKSGQRKDLAVCTDELRAKLERRHAKSQH